jgi:hypothetical protein
VLAAPLADPGPVLELVDSLAAPIADLLAGAGIDERDLEPALV